jgi:hypothetical protein
MRPQIVNQVGTGSSNSILFDYHGGPEVALQVDVTGTVNWTVQQTLQNPNDASTAPVSWFDHPDANLVGQTAGRQGNYAFVPMAARITVNSGSGSVRFTALQANPPGGR